MIRLLPKWCELLDSAGWCVALSQPDRAASIWPHAKAVLKGRGLEPDSWTELLAALAHVMPTDRPVQGEYLQIWTERDLAAAEETAEPVSITIREQEIYHWLQEGKSTREVAVIINCERRTVEKHIGNLYRKLGVSSRTMAILRLRPGSESPLQALACDTFAPLLTANLSLYETDAMSMGCFVKSRLDCGMEASFEKLDPVLLSELMKGLPVSMIAKSLAIRSDSVQRRLRTIRDELGVDNNRQLFCMLNLLRAG